ncbi:zinc ABC transporter substrate-binding protein [Photobacterium jeanii]|uniref:High-affinity zinc uptake system protein ZnuA n=1 Tax=Photobacterium jeanii TaxID=858640 RepID=A0A178KMM3_9GAMM|nr:zinc ABC transporter substrate-binding protein ZnuA [Photobacterium jeanii]OAN18491.1 zinc ABC transporter substrate-binding protein [Photobacterium jeanii]PST91827.1 zinc ABC transporter substrate-binding protein ZnuA [Photobacterium jeanii]
MSRFISFGLIGIFLFSSASFAKEFNVVTSVKPLQLIVQELTAGVSEPQVLLPAGASPHDYALKPSDVKKIHDADLVIWVGPELETFMVKVLKNEVTNLALTESDRIDFLHYEHDDHSDHADHGHSHDGVDPHFWMGPTQAMQAANVITTALIDADPLHKNEYEVNLAKFQDSVKSATEQLTTQLKPVADHGYYVFHDGYGYFETYFKLNNLGHFTVKPDRRPGAKTLISIRRALLDKQAYCVFSEPQFSPAVVSSVVNGTDVKIGTLDPMATNIAYQQGGYIAFLNELGQSFTNCLK